MNVEEMNEEKNKINSNESNGSSTIVSMEADKVLQTKTSSVGEEDKSISKTLSNSPIPPGQKEKGAHTTGGGSSSNKWQTPPHD